MPGPSDRLQSRPCIPIYTYLASEVASVMPDLLPEACRRRPLPLRFSIDCDFITLVSPQVTLRASSLRRRTLLILSICHMRPMPSLSFFARPGLVLMERAWNHFC